MRKKEMLKMMTDVAKDNKSRGGVLMPIMSGIALSAGVVGYFKGSRATARAFDSLVPRLISKVTALKLTAEIMHDAEEEYNED